MTDDNNGKWQSETELIRAFDGNFVGESFQFGTNEGKLFASVLCSAENI